MVSVIICHVDKRYLGQVARNIEKTIGIPYELIVIDNTANRYNIFQAYNEGVRKSNYDLLCFVHEDVLFHTSAWGRNLVQHFEDASIGLVGTIGGTAFPSVPAPWWNNTILNRPHMNLIQHWKQLKVPEGWVKAVINKDKNVVHQYLNPSGKPVADAVAVDGVFFCIRKDFFKQGYRFDEETFNGFHCYDTDTCFQVLKAGYRVVVVFDILLEHFSLGTINTSWATSVEKLVDKWQSHLPWFTTIENNNSTIEHYNHKALLTYCYWLQKMNYDDQSIRGIIKKYFKRAGVRFKYKESLLLNLWRLLGYHWSRYPFAALKYFVR